MSISPLVSSELVVIEPISTDLIERKSLLEKKYETAMNNIFVRTGLPKIVFEPSILAIRTGASANIKASTDMYMWIDARVGIPEVEATFSYAENDIDRRELENISVRRIS